MAGAPVWGSAWTCEPHWPQNRAVSGSAEPQLLQNIVPRAIDQIAHAGAKSQYKLGSGHSI
jgi:hypothetical protein